MSDKIRAILNSYHADTLHEMAEAAGLEVLSKNEKKLRKADLIKNMIEGYFTRARVRKSLAQLSERERAILNRLLLRDGIVSSRAFQRELLRADLAAPGKNPEPPQPKDPRYYHYYHRPDVPYARGYVGRPNRADSTVFEDLLAHLTYLGLVFSRDTLSDTVPASFKIQFHPASFLYIPQLIRPYLPEPEPVPPPLAGWQPNRVKSGDPSLLLRNLYLYWDLVRRGRVDLLKTGFVNKHSLKALNEVLVISDPQSEETGPEDETGRLSLLRGLLQLIGLIHKEQNRLRPTGQDACHIPAFWGKSQIEQVNDCLAAWPRLSGLVELGRQVSYYDPRYATARKIVLEAIKRRPARAWIEPDEILEELQIQNMNFLFADHSGVELQRNKSSYSSHYYSEYTGNYYSAKPAELLEKFDRLEFEFVKRCVSGFLFQLGLIELGYDLEKTADRQAAGHSGDTWRAFRLTPAGRAVLGLETAVRTEQHAGRLVIQPNFQVIAIGPVNLAWLAKLDLFAEREQADRGAFQYRISRESVYAGQQAGLSVSGIIDFLTEVGDTELAQNVRRTLEEWAGHHQRIVFRTGVSLLQTAQADLLAGLLEKSPTNKFLARPVSTEMALINNDRQGEMVSALVERGLFPVITGAKPESADRSVIIEDDGLIRPIHAVPSLYLPGRLAPLAEETEAGQWRLTPASVRRAGGNRNKALRLLEELERLNRGALPGCLADRIRAWGGYYGQAAIETLTLIEFSDPVALAELSRQPDLQPYLTPFPADSRALAIIPIDELDRVKEILAGLGVQVKVGLPRRT